MPAGPPPLKDDPTTAKLTHPLPPLVALVGNPNTGKTSLFNALTGFRRHVANYPGVTVDLARGRIRESTTPLEIVDLPGTYSLAAHSPDEMIVCNALCGNIPRMPRPSIILVIVDAANPLRNLYLLSQVLELGIPVVVALNMTDVAAARGIEYDLDRLSEALGVPIVPIVAKRSDTTRAIVPLLEQALDASPPSVCAPLPDVLRKAAETLRAQTDDRMQTAEALRALVDRNGCAERHFVERYGGGETIEHHRQQLRDANIDPGAAEVRARYAWVDQIVAEAITRKPPAGDGWSHRIDQLMTHRIGGAVALLLILYGLFYSIYSLADPLMTQIEGAFTWLGSVAAGLLPGGAIESLVVDGVIGGVGGVIVFLPQILILFLFIAILEDCGYLARAAFMVDRLMRPLGLSGRAFIPLLSSFACAVPAILATRTIADHRERFITILVAPFMSCSARLPVYVLLIGAFIPPTRWLGGWVRLDALTMLAMYLVGVVVAIPVALILRKTTFRGPPSAFLLELPSYKLPQARTIYQRVALAGRSFLVRAGTVILIVNLLVWALAYFPRTDSTRDVVTARAAGQNWDDAHFENELAGAYLRDSYLARMGRFIEPAVRPIGWDWRIGVGVIASFPAREVIVATLGTVLNLGEEADAEAVPLRDALRAARWSDSDEPLFTIPVALSIMVFFALSAQCAATLATIGKETASWSWPIFSFVLMTALAYGGAWLTAGVARAAGL